MVRRPDAPNWTELGAVPENVRLPEPATVKGALIKIKPPSEESKPLVSNVLFVPLLTNIVRDAELMPLLVVCSVPPLNIKKPLPKRLSPPSTISVPPLTLVLPL